MAFYLRVATASNSLVGVSSRLPGLLQEHLSTLSSEGLISEADSVRLNWELTNTADVEDAVLEPILSVTKARKHNGLVAIMRGIPGSGKSFLLRKIDEWRRIHICSADSYFEQDGSYNFNKKELAYAHEHCLDCFLDGIENGVKFLAVDNTNTQLWEYTVYRRLAELFGYHVEVVELTCLDSATLKQFALRNSHAVPFQTIQGMYERWEADPTAQVIRPWIECETEGYDPSEQLISVFSEHLADEGNVESRREVMYTAVFLTARSIATLLRTINPAYVNIQGDHLTLAYKPGEAHLQELPFGQNVHMVVRGVANDRQVQAVAVELLEASNVECTNAVPHVTVSTGAGAPAHLANEILGNNGGANIRPCAQIHLDGVVGCVVRRGQKGQNGTLQRVVDRGEFSRVTSSTEKETKSDEPVFGSAAALYVFDFDGTLFDTPGPIEGKKEYLLATGRPWPQGGWYSRSETLMPPLKVYPGPALHQFRTHCGRSGSVTVVLTGRLERSRDAVERVLAAGGVRADRVILKNMDMATEDFKNHVISSLLVEFPKIKHVKIWEDLPENLSAFHKLSHRFPKIRWDIIDALSLECPMFESPTAEARPSPSYQGPGSRLGVSEYLSAAGAFSQKEHRDATRVGLRFIAKAWASAIHYHGNAMHLVVPFGSSSLGRAGDVDLCLLGPEKLSYKDCMTQLRYQLEKRGVRRTYLGHSSRCPRLRACLEFGFSPPVEFDIVFCRVAADMIADGLKAIDGEQLMAAAVKGDPASKAAASGPAFHAQVMKAVENPRRMRQFAVAIEVLVQILRARNLKGNAFHCPRTFQLVKVLARHALESDTEAKSSDEFVAAAINHMAGLTRQDWVKVFGDLVPNSYIDSLVTALSEAKDIVNSEAYPRWRAVHQLLNSGDVFPPEGNCIVSLHCRSRDAASLWRLTHFLEARAGTYIRNLLKSGVTVVPGDVVRFKDESRLEFAVPERSIMAVQRQCQPLVDEVRCHEARSNSWVEVRVPREKRTHQRRPGGSVG